MTDFLKQEQTRGWIYRIALAVGALLVTYGFIGESELAEWAFLVAALLGLGSEGLATKNTSIKKEQFND